MVVPGLAVDTELRWALLRRLAVTGRAGDAEIDAELACDPTDAGRRHAAASRAAIPDAAHKAAGVGAASRRSQELGHEGVMAVAGGFGQPEHAAPAGAVRRTRTSRCCRRSGRAAVITSSGCWATGCSRTPAASPELLRRVDEFLAAEPRDPSMVRMLVERRDIVERALLSRELPD